MPISSLTPSSQFDQLISISNWNCRTCSSSRRQVEVVQQQEEELQPEQWLPLREELQQMEELLLQQHLH
jgi:hypothetical protein